MPIFVSRFSSARNGLANFQALRTAVEDVRTDRRASASRERERNREEERDQTAPSGEDRRGASTLLVTSQRADQVAQRVTDQNASSRASERRESNGRANGRSPETAQRSASTAGNAPEASREERGRQAQAQREEPETRVVLRPVLRSAAQRLDGLTRLISAQRRGEEPAVGTEPAARARLSTSLRIEQTAAQSDVVRTAQAAQVSQAQQAPRTTEAARTQPEPRAEDRIRETTELKQDLREDVATVARGLVKDAVRQNTRNARRIAQGTLQAAQAHPTTTLARPLLQRAPLSQSLFSNRVRQAPTISNLSPLRSALALLGTNVNILVG
ncbi:MAG: hypothetical protein A3F84_18080 [Candidatus Handelsmanbacteria bacterium RIFCSPLOWO2_12_FULL_64_10]|uniref:Uncharacterized protein n=1 Tax=Handelsmanbacteria sp. (strain RIFCSPLOWO2_12_FULL_64_10) TaxID=1817868 RepID=A0A1F6CML2_HANXR|nr:MAG: hypothetical protein A3F84_18080 [Candidatus Handelsmanbacteria bacterium RIFCSPLOWO2_12_FULL_64_10]